MCVCNLDKLPVQNVRERVTIRIDVMPMNPISGRMFKESISGHEPDAQGAQPLRACLRLVTRAKTYFLKF
jgi:hypothetical protein